MTETAIVSATEGLQQIARLENIIITEGEKQGLVKLVQPLVATLTNIYRRRPDPSPSSRKEIHAGNHETTLSWTTLSWNAYYSFVIPTTFYIWNALLFGNNSLNKRNTWVNLSRHVDASMYLTLRDHCLNVSGDSMDFTSRQLVTLTIFMEGAAHCLLDIGLLEAIRPELSRVGMGKDADVKDYLTAAGNFVRMIREAYLKKVIMCPSWIWNGTGCRNWDKSGGLAQVCHWALCLAGLCLAYQKRIFHTQTPSDGRYVLGMEPLSIINYKLRYCSTLSTRLPTLTLQ